MEESYAWIARASISSLEVHAVEPAIVSVIIKTDRLRKRLPKVGEMVRLMDHKGLFKVIRVDKEQRAADLMQRALYQEVLETNVPFNLIRTVPRGASRAIQNFLHS